MSPQQHSVGAGSASITMDWSDGELAVNAESYRWTWSSQSDQMELCDTQQRSVVSGPVQPAIVLADGGAQRGVVQDVRVDIDARRVEIQYLAGDLTINLAWRFTPETLWCEPVTISSPSVHDVVSVHFFSGWDDGGSPVPGLSSHYLVHPGLSESSALGPVMPAKARIEAASWLGRGSNDCQDILSQQWGLPIHYFAGFSIRGSMLERSALTRELSDSFCLGLTGVPTGDLLLHHGGERVSPVLRLHSDLWGHVRTGGDAIEVGAGWLWTIAKTYDDAMRRYYRELVAAGLVSIKERSERANAILAKPQFNTWGAQCAAGVAMTNFHQEALETIYSDVLTSGMKPGLFVIDDKWEGEYGLLQHDEERFPRFEEFLDQVRDDGVHVGLWAAFLRCDNPASNGLTIEHMLRDPDGKPVKRNLHDQFYYLFDVSQEPVREVLRQRAQEFVRRYRPDLVKFDFGYELPALIHAAPAIREWGGEILLVKALELVVGAMREVAPDLLVMYYNLSPFLTEHIDLVATDDMYLCADEYHFEANRRLFFSSLMGEVGVASYGSGGYDWLRIRDIWFDTALFGPVGSLGSFAGDPRDSAASPLDIATYNGIAALTRPTHHFAVEALDPLYLGGSLGARSSSWLRREQGEIVGAALRSHSLDGRRLDPALDGIVEADGSIIVMSRDAVGLGETSELGIVAIPERGEAVQVALSSSGMSVTASAHLLGGATVELAVTTDVAGVATFQVPALADGVAPVEWVQVRRAAL